MAFQSNQLTTPDGKQVLAPASGVAKRTTTALAIGASWDTGIVYYNGNRNIQISFASDQNGSFKVEYFDSNGVLLPFMGNTTSYNAADGVFQAGIAAKGDAVKITYTNNGTAQTSFFFELALLNTPIQETLRSVSTPMSATNLASTTHAVVEGREAATGSYKQATVSQVGDKVALDVNVINRSNETQKVEITNPTPVSFPSNQNVTVSNFPATQVVSGNIEVSNDSGNPLPVSGSVSISNLPSTQPVSGTVAISNPVTSVSVSNLPSTQAVSGTVTISNFPATQPVSGTVNANVTFPTTQNVAGSVSISNLPATQPISAATLPLPAGAATSALQTTGNSSLSSIDTKITLDADGGMKIHQQQPSTGITTTQTTLATVTTALAANTARKGATIFSVSGTILIKLGSGASTTNFTHRIITNGYYEIPFGYTGIITVIGAGTINVTELT